VDFYGRRGFDCICITDHIADRNGSSASSAKLANLDAGLGSVDEYFDMIARETAARLAEIQHAVMAGLEFNKEGFTRKTSGHCSRGIESAD